MYDTWIGGVATNLNRKFSGRKNVVKRRSVLEITSLRGLWNTQQSYPSAVIYAVQESGLGWRQEI